MANPLNSAEFVRLLDTRLTKVTESRAKFRDLQSMIPTLFAVATSNSAWEEFFEVGGVPDILPFGGTINYLSVSPGYLTRMEHKEYAGGLQVQRKLMDDKKYAVLDRNALGLIDSAYRVREKKAARAWQYAFSTAFDFMYSEEGKSWCSTTHLTRSSISTSSGFSNSGTSALTPTSLNTTRLLMRRFKTDIGERYDVGDNLALVVPDTLVDTAMEIVKTPKGLDTGDGNINPQAGRYQIIAYKRLDDVDTNNWFMVDLDRLKDTLMFYDRIKAEYKTTVDFDTYMILQAVYERFSYGFTDWRAVYGHKVS